MYKYKLKEGAQRQTTADGVVVVGVGIVKGGHITSDTPIENPNLELVEQTTTQAIPAPAHANGVVSQATQPVAPVQAPAPVEQASLQQPVQAPAPQIQTAPAVESNNGQ